MDAAVWAMEYFQEHLRGRRFILYTDHKPLEILGTLHMKTMNRLQLAMMDFDFEIRYKNGSERPVDFLSRSFTEINAITVLDIDWVHEEEKDNLSSLIKESLNKQWVYKFLVPEWYKKAEHLAEMAIMRKNDIWIKKDGKKMIYVPYAKRRELLLAICGSWRSVDRARWSSEMQRKASAMLFLAEHGQGHFGSHKGMFKNVKPLKPADSKQQHLFNQSHNAA
jgi:hypothetical protein